MKVLSTSQDVSITLSGGYGCDYSMNPGFTTVHGTLTISQGTVIIDNSYHSIDEKLVDIITIGYCCSQKVFFEAQVDISASRLLLFSHANNNHYSTNYLGSHNCQLNV